MSPRASSFRRGIGKGGVVSADVPLCPQRNRISGAKPANLSPEEESIRGALGTETRHIDEIITASGIPTGGVSKCYSGFREKRI